MNLLILFLKLEKETTNLIPVYTHLSQKPKNRKKHYTKTYKIFWTIEQLIVTVSKKCLKQSPSDEAITGGARRR